MILDEIKSASIQLKKPHKNINLKYTNIYLLGLVSGATMMTPCSAAYFCAPALVIKFCSVQVNPGGQQHIVDEITGLKNSHFIYNIKYYNPCFNISIEINM